MITKTLWNLKRDIEDTILKQFKQGYSTKSIIWFWKFLQSRDCLAVTILSRTQATQ